MTEEVTYDDIRDWVDDLNGSDRDALKELDDVAFAGKKHIRIGIYDIWRVKPVTRIEKNGEFRLSIATRRRHKYSPFNPDILPGDWFEAVDADDPIGWDVILDFLSQRLEAAVNGRVSRIRETAPHLILSNE